jgi:hypothetical protein
VVVEHELAAELQVQLVVEPFGPLEDLLGLLLEVFFLEGGI